MYEYSQKGKYVDAFRPLTLYGDFNDDALFCASCHSCHQQSISLMGNFFDLFIVLSDTSPNLVSFHRHVVRFKSILKERMSIEFPYTVAGKTPEMIEADSLGWIRRCAKCCHYVNNSEYRTFGDGEKSIFKFTNIHITTGSEARSHICPSPNGPHHRLKNCPTKFAKNVAHQTEYRDYIKKSKKKERSQKSTTLSIWDRLI